MTTQSHGAAVVSTNARSLVEIARNRAIAQPDRLAYSFVESGAETRAIAYGELDRRARSVAAALQSADAEGERVLLLYPSGLDYVASFLGCLYAGAIAVPAYPPRANRTIERLSAIVEDASPRIVLAPSQIASSPLASAPELSNLHWIASDTLDDALAERWVEPGVDGETLAFLQYTSGSTSSPKGVMVSHANLLHNERAIAARFAQSEESIVVGWLPLYHDMGLIGTVLQPLYLGATCVLMSPAAFLQRPALWLETISRYRATTSGGPNFAYELCARRVTAEQRAGLDLRSWRTAFNGSEPVRAETLDRFARAFAPCGFARSAFVACYGLAESTLLVAAAGDGEPRTVDVRADEFERNLVVEATGRDRNARTLVGCGTAGDEQTVVVAVSPDSLALCGPGEIGELWVSGPSVAQGYWNRPELTESTFRATLPGDGRKYLRTGDLGFVGDGEIFVTGRIKDLVIVRGRNLYPQDIELTVERSSAALRAGSGAAFSIEVEGEEQLVVIHELEPRARADVSDVVAAVRARVADEHDVEPYAVALVKAGSVPRTSSGKIRRQETKHRYLGGSLELVASWQSARDLQSPGAADVASDDAPKDVAAWIAALVARRIGVAVESIDVAAPLAAYGLDSLAAAELAHEIEERLGVRVLLSDLLDGASAATLAAVVRDAAPVAPTLAGSTEPSDALSHGQRTLWFLHQLDPHGAAYNIARAVRVLGPLDAAALEHAFDRLVERFAILRTVYPTTDGNPVRRVLDAHGADFERVDAAELSNAELDAALAEASDRAFDLERGPILRVRLFERSDAEHVLLVCVHHIAADLRSMTRLLDELGALYGAEVRGKAVPPPAPASDYADYVVWERDMLASAEGERLWRFWHAKLGGALPVLELPTDRPRPSVQTSRGASISTRVAADVADRLRARASESGATLYVTLLAAFNALLARYSGSADVVVGSPTAGRAAAGVGGDVGYFVNPVAIRTRVDLDAPASDLVAATRTEVLDALDHQELPFGLLVQRLEPDRDPSRSPIFQVMFSLQAAPGSSGTALSAIALGEEGSRFRIGPLDAEPVRLGVRHAQFDLSLMMAEGESGLLASFEYNADLFERETIERMAGHYLRLLDAFSKDPSRSVAELDMLTASERDLVVHAWNATALDFDRTVLVHELVERAADRFPDRVAVAGSDWSLTFRELDARASRIALHLRALGAGPDRRVAVLLDRGERLVVALLATLKAGAAYLPLDPAYPAERLRFMLEDADVCLVLTTDALGSRLVDGAHADSVVRLDRLDDAFERPPVRRFARVASPANLAVVIYTSGSTGRPKGVSLEHRSAVALVAWAESAFSSEELADVLFSTSVCFDLSVFELFVTLARGGSVHLVDNALALPEYPLRDRISLVNTVPSAAAELLRLGAIPGSVRTINLAGEPLPRTLADGLYAAGPVERVTNLYGPTEDTVYSTWCDVRRGETGAVPIGRPVSNSRAYVLDARMRPVPIGVIGEVYLGGDGLARGYLGRPGLTAERFVPDSVSGEAGARLYRTGDLGRFRHDGAIEYRGRIDGQVKVRGFRIEVGEIEAALSGQDGVEAAAVVARAFGGSTRLVAYVVPSAGDVDTARLREALRRTLPEFMIPSAFVVLDALPRTPNGKLDRRALPEPSIVGTADGAFAAPRSPLEETICAVWADALGVARVGRDDNFFELGGHSLLATQVVSRLGQLLGVELSLRDLFADPTPRGLAAAARPGAVAPPPLVAGLGSPDLLSYGQQRLWFFDQLEPGSPLYNCPAAVRLRGPLDLDAVVAALTDLVRRHEILRTTYAAVDGRAVASVADPAPFRLELDDLRALAPDARPARVAELARHEAELGFDLAVAPLLRVRVVRTDDDEHIALFTVHHIASDGWSLGVLVRELGALYEARARGLEPELDEPELQYRDWAAWQRVWLEGAEMDRQLAYWRDRLDGAPEVLELPADRPRSAVKTTRGASEAIELGAEVAAGLRRIARERGVTAFMVLLAGLDVLLWAMSGQEDVVVGTPIANRSHREAEGIVGMMVNTLALRVGLDGDPTFADLLDRVRETALGAYAHQDLPFEKLVEHVNPSRALSHAPVFQVLLVLQNTPSLTMRFGDVEMVPTRTDNTAKFDLVLDATEHADGIECWFVYKTDLWDSASIARIAERYRTVLESALEDPSLRLSALGERIAAADRAWAERQQQAFKEARGRRLRDARKRQAGA